MKKNNIKWVLAVVIAVAGLASGTAFAATDAQKAVVTKAIAKAPIAELSMKAARTVSAAKQAEKEDMAVAAVEVVVAKHPALAANLVSSIASLVPEVAAKAASKAAELNPDQAVSIARAAALAAPKYAAEIAMAVGQAVPKTQVKVAEAVVAAVPKAMVAVSTTVKPQASTRSMASQDNSSIERSTDAINPNVNVQFGDRTTPPETPDATEGYDPARYATP